MKACLRLFVGIVLLTLIGLPLTAQESRQTLRITMEDEVGGVLVAVLYNLAPCGQWPGA